MTTPNETTSNGEARAGFHVALYSPAWRAVAGALRVVSGASLLAIAAALVLTSAGPVNPLHLIRLVAGLWLLPRLAAFLLDRGFAARVTFEGSAIVFSQRHRRVEIPCSSIVGLSPWRLPLPGAGFDLRLRSGRRWHDGVQANDPGEMVRALAAAGTGIDVADASEDPGMAYARARWRVAGRGPLRLLLKFPVFALVPALPLFRVHQLIAYGGAFGEYHQYGLGAYLQGFGIYWATLTIYLMLYAAVLRLPVEFASIGAAALAPARAGATRRFAERTGAILYYGGVPVGIILRFLPW